MNLSTTLAFAGIQHERVRKHLFPGDDLEAAAVLLCSRSAPPRVRLLVRDYILIPYDTCRIRQRDAITWPGSYIEEAIDRALGKRRLFVCDIRSVVGSRGWWRPE